MGKPKRVPVLTVADPGPVALAELNHQLHSVLLAANRGPRTEAQRPLAIQLHHALTFVSRGEDVHLPPAFSLSQRVSFDNLKALVLRGGFYLPQCSE